MERLANKSIVELGASVEELVFILIQMLGVITLLFFAERQVCLGLSNQFFAVIVAERHHFLGNGKRLPTLLSFGPGEAKSVTFILL